MNIFPALQTILYTIATALLYPVVVLLIFLTLWMLVYAGGFAAEWVKRSHFRRKEGLSDALESIYEQKKLPQSLKESLPLHVTAYSKALSDLIKKQGMFTAERIEEVNQKIQYKLLGEVDKIRLIVRVGPSLGLMGTLIPMGTGLAGLTQGNMAQLSSSLILAFTTTVIGLALGISAHFFSVVKERWVCEDMIQINLITEALSRPVVQKIREVKAA